MSPRAKPRGLGRSVPNRDLPSPPLWQRYRIVGQEHEPLRLEQCVIRGGALDFSAPLEMTWPQQLGWAAAIDARILEIAFRRVRRCPC